MRFGGLGRRAELVRLASEVDGARVALVRSRPEPALADALGAVEYDADDPELHVRLAAAGLQDLVIDLGNSRGRRRRFPGLLMHTRPGGTLAVLVPSPGRARRELRNLVETIRRLHQRQEPPPRIGMDPRARKRRDRLALAASVQAVQRRGAYLVAVNGIRTLPRLTETETDRWVELRRTPDRILEQLPPARLRSRAIVRTYPEGTLPMVSELLSPTLSLRLLHDVTGHGRQLVHTDDVVLPASFRHHTRPRQPHESLADWSPGFVRVPDTPHARALPGAWYFVDNEYRGHFGHDLTELVSLLWGWERARALVPGIRPLSFVNEKHGGLKDWERVLLAAYGVTDVHVAEGPHRIERLVTATPMYVMPGYVHPELAGIYQRIGDALAGQAVPRDRPSRIFVGRDQRKRVCRNAEEVETWFTDAGFEIVRPEELDLPDQVALFRSAEAIAGYSGSGMFQTALTGGPRHVITIAPETYFARNEYLIASLVGHRLDRIFCQPEVTVHEAKRWTEAYQSPYTVDPAREGAFLRRILAEL